MQLKTAFPFLYVLMGFLFFSCNRESDPINNVTDPLIGTWDVTPNPNGHHTLGVNENGVFGVSYGGDFNFLGQWENLTHPQDYNALNQYYQFLYEGELAEEEDTIHLVFESNFKAFHYGGPEGTVYKRRK